MLLIVSCGSPETSGDNIEGDLSDEFDPDIEEVAPEDVFDLESDDAALAGQAINANLPYTARNYTWIRCISVEEGVVTYDKGEGNNQLLLNLVGLGVE